LPLEEDALARLLMVRACEECDPKGLFLPHMVRERASQKAGVSHAEVAAEDARELLLGRAGPLLDRLEGEQPSLRSARRLVAWRPPFALFVALGLALGLGLDSLGTERHINLLALPLLGLLAWNLAAYASQLLAPVVFRSPPATRGLTRWITHAGLWWASRGRGLKRAVSSDAARFASSSLAHFAQLWLERAGALQLARVRCRLHVGAMAFCLGVVGSMYLSGFAYAYRASWESTFLDPPAVHGLLAGILSPASVLLGVPLPSVSEIAALRAPGSGEAATWIHLWAITALLGIGLPRALLALREGWLARQRAARLDVDLDEPYFLRLLSALRGDGHEVDVLLYSTELSSQTSASLRELLYEVFGNRAQVQIALPIQYGEPPPPARLPDGARHCTVVIFNLAQSPEQEVHGRFLETCKLRTEARPGQASLLVLLDEEHYRSTQGDQRVDERGRSWARVLRETGLVAARLSSSSQEEEADLLGLARQALWPPPPEVSP